VKYGSQIADEMTRRGVVAELVAAQRVAYWAYAKMEAANGLTSVHGDELVPPAAAWRGLLDFLDIPRFSTAAMITARPGQNGRFFGHCRSGAHARLLPQSEDGLVVAFGEFAV
jgi:hypothetical protein